MSYEASLKHRRDAESVYNSAIRSGEALGHAKGRAEGRQEGKAEGKAEGREEEKKESAIKMLEKGFDVKMISEILGLAVGEIEKLK